MKTNKNGSKYRIIINFFILCTSVLFATGGHMESLAGVYTFSFLAVTALFGIGNLLLKFKRQKLQRPERARGISVVVAIAFVVAAFIGNIDLNDSAFATFIKYLIPALIAVFVMLNRSVLIRFGLAVSDYFYQPVRKFAVLGSRSLHRMNQKVKSQEFVFFTKGDDVAILNKVLQYVQNNEPRKNLKNVNVKKPPNSNEALKVDLEVLYRAYPDIHIEFIEIEGFFGPDLITELSEKWDIPKNFMFIISPADRFFHRVSDLGGVRLIM